MANITIIGRELFALKALDMLKSKRHNINKVITDDQGILWQSARQLGIETQLKGKCGKVCADDIYNDTDAILSLYNYMYIDTCAITKVDKTIGYHPSLLPAYKGRRAIQDAISAGECQTGGTLFYLDDGYDTGKTISQRTCVINSGDKPKDVWARLEVIGLELLGELIKDW